MRDCTPVNVNEPHSTLALLTQHYENFQACSADCDNTTLRRASSEEGTLAYIII